MGAQAVDRGSRQSIGAAGSRSGQQAVDRGGRQSIGAAGIDHGAGNGRWRRQNVNSTLGTKECRDKSIKVNEQTTASQTHTYHRLLHRAAAQRNTHSTLPAADPCQNSSRASVEGACQLLPCNRFTHQTPTTPCIPRQQAFDSNEGKALAQ